MRALPAVLALLLACEPPCEDPPDPTPSLAGKWKLEAGRTTDLGEGKLRATLLLEQVDRTITGTVTVHRRTGSEAELPIPVSGRILYNQAELSGTSGEASFELTGSFEADQGAVLVRADRGDGEGVQVLELSGMLRDGAPPDDHGEDAAHATAITEGGGWVTGSFSRRGSNCGRTQACDEDWFRFTAPEAGTFILESAGRSALACELHGTGKAVAGKITPNFEDEVCHLFRCRVEVSLKAKQEVQLRLYDGQNVGPRYGVRVSRPASPE